MPIDDLDDLTDNLDNASADLDVLWQNQLLGERNFTDFAREMQVLGAEYWADILTDFVKRGWLRADGTGHDGKPLFHPFRLYAFGESVSASRVSIGPPLSVEPDICEDLEQVVRANLPQISGIDSIARQANRITDLALLLEPLYWPRIMASYVRHGTADEAQFWSAMRRYEDHVHQIVEKLDPARWKQAHTALRVRAANIDPNDELYLLLRLANRDRRDRLRGRVGYALLLREMAEVIRRGFEEVHAVRWLEEDIAFGWWQSGARERSYGAERPLDTEMESTPRLAWRFGLLTGSVVRWYVEGETEYHAIRSALGRPELYRIELVNLHGELNGKGNKAMKLEAMLKEDLALRRFSMISFDCDVKTNADFVRRQIRLNRVVGHIGAHDPDFEFANFDVLELAEVAARLDEEKGFDGNAVRMAGWDGIADAKAFTDRYLDVSARHPRGLKGEEWGAALVRYATEHPKQDDPPRDRSFWGEIRAALSTPIADYDAQSKMSTFDPVTFAHVDRKEQE